MKRSIIVAAVCVCLAVLAFGLWWRVGMQREDTTVVTQRLDDDRGAERSVDPGAGGEALRGDGAGSEGLARPAESTGTGAAMSSVAVGPDDTPELRLQIEREGADGDAPSFDVVRVEPGGDAVLAGRAKPDSKVTIKSNGETFGTVTSNARGEWAFVSEAPLNPGDHEISLSAETAAGEQVEAEEVVVVSIPAPEPGTSEGSGTAPQDTPVTVLIPKDEDQPIRVLQVPRGEGISVNDLVLEAIDYDPSGRLIVAGRATISAQIIVYLNNRPLGGAVTDGGGRWTVTSAEALMPGLHELRIDQIDGGGKVVARVQTPLSRSELLTGLPDDQFFIVQPGNSLWRIARRAYGDGVRYTMIFEANQGQIRNPDLIYPGQIFVLPTE